MSVTIKLEKCKMDLRYLKCFSCYRYKGWTTEPKIWKFTEFYCWIWKKKFRDYQWIIGNITGKHRKTSKTTGSESSAKSQKENCDCGDTVTGWGLYGRKPQDNECQVQRKHNKATIIWAILPPYITN